MYLMIVVMKMEESVKMNGEDPLERGMVQEVEQVKCECCEHIEECTPTYIAHVKSLFCGKWICGLCGDAVNEEYIKASGNYNVNEGGHSYILENALESHMSVCRQFNVKVGTKGAINEKYNNSPVDHLVQTLKRLLQRSKFLPTRSAPSSPNQSLISINRNNSCLNPFSRSHMHESSPY